MSDEKQRALHQACGNYLKSHETKRIMKALLEKFRSYGDAKGIMVLTKPTPGECLFARLIKETNDARYYDTRPFKGF